MERDEVYVPKTREDLGIPDKPHEEIEWNEFFSDTPIYTLYMLIRQQLAGFPAYLRERPIVDLSQRIMLTFCGRSIQRLRAKGISEVDQSFRP
jgi:hypothetical protein